MPIKAADYDFLCHFLQQQSGLALGAGKEYLLESRLVPLAESWGLPHFEDLVKELRGGRNPRLLTAVTEAMTTNETSFFRDKSPFEDLRQHLLPELIAARQTTRNLRFWCAAASSGQEVYSVLMLLAEHFPLVLKQWTFDFVATDISQQILTKAEAAVYSQFEIQRGLPIQHLVKYFDQSPGGYQIKPELRQRVKFRTLNLLDDFSRIGTCDIIFCRNVLIYFDVETKRNILERIHSLLRKDGALFLGSAETVLGIADCFQRRRDCTSAVYAPARSQVPAR